MEIQSSYIQKQVVRTIIGQVEFSKVTKKNSQVFYQSCL